jgi:hypothetical protein
MKWAEIPVCFLPERLRGVPINQIELNTMEPCHEITLEEGKDAASTLYLLDESKIGIIFFMAISICVLVLLILIVISILFCKSRRRSTEIGKCNANIEEIYHKNNFIGETLYYSENL